MRFSLSSSNSGIHEPDGPMRKYDGPLMGISTNFNVELLPDIAMMISIRLKQLD